MKDVNVTNLMLVLGVSSHEGEYRNAETPPSISFPEDANPCEIPSHCFSDAENLREFHCPSSVCKICDYAFAGCKSLLKFILKEDSKLAEIGNSAFKDCCIREFAITKDLIVDICDFTGIISLGDNYNNNYLIEAGLLISVDKKSLLGIFSESEDVCIPSSIEFIHSSAFHSKLKRVSFAEGSKVRTMELDPSEAWFIEELVLPAAFEDISGVPPQNIGKVEFEIGNLNFESFDADFVMSTDSRVMWRYFGKSENVVVPSYVEKIGFRCFADSSLKSISFENESEVREFGDGAFSRASLVSITLPDSLESIGKDCFAYSSDLTEIEFPSSLVHVGDGAFACSAIQNVSLVSCNLENLSEYMFRSSRLARIVIPRSIIKIDGCCFYSCSSLVEVLFESESQLMELGSACFQNTSIESICIPRLVRKIGWMCFAECRQLRSVSFDDGSELTTLENACFKETSLEKICLPGSVIELGSGCFGMCEKLEEFRFEDGAMIRELGNIFGGTCRVKAFLPKSVEVISREFLAGISHLELEPGSSFSVSGARVFDKQGMLIGVMRNDVSVDGKYMIRSGTELSIGMFRNNCEIRLIKFDSEWTGTALHKELFRDSSLEEIVVPKCVITIGQWCFSGCKKLRTVEFERGSELKKIFRDAFANTGLENIVIPRLVEEIESRAFYGCKSLAKVEFEDESQLKVIQTNAFTDTSLTSIVIPDSVTEICDLCFQGTKLTECIIGENSQLETLGRKIFGNSYGDKLPHLFIPSRVVNISGESLFGIANITISPRNPNLSVCQDFVMSSDQTALYGLSKPKDSVVIPKNVRVIKKGCFCGREELTSAEFEDQSNLEVVECNAFSSTSLNHIKFPRKLRKLCDRFGDLCETITEISFDDDCSLEEISSFGYLVEGIILHVPSNVSKIDSRAIQCAKEVHVCMKNPYIGASNQFVYRLSGELLGQIGRGIEVVIPKSVTMILEETFKPGPYEEGHIVSVAFEKGSLLCEIGKNAFVGHNSLKTVSFEHVLQLKRIGENAFAGCDLLSIEIPRSVEMIGPNAFKNVLDVSVQEGSLHFSAVNGMLMNRRETHLAGFYGTNTQPMFVLEKQVQVIGKLCFDGYEGNDFTFEEGSDLKTIEDRAFYQSRFRRISIPASLVTVGDECFCDCWVDTIEFERVSNLAVFTKAMFRSSRLKTIVVPANVIEFGIECFAGASDLVSVLFEHSPNLVCIRKRCFSDCTQLELFEFERCSKLRYIYEEAFAGTNLSKAVLYQQIEFISQSSFDNRCNISIDGSIEDRLLLEWTKERNGDFMKRRGNEFYLGGDFRRTELLGSGSFGKVYLVENQFTSEMYAVKEMHNGLTTKVQFEKEIEIMKAVMHPCTVCLKGYTMYPSMTLCMEYFSEGTLQDTLSSAPSWFDATSRVIIIVGIVAGMTHIHSVNVLHRDLKPSNILLDGLHEPKIADFGTARSDSNACTLNVGTRLYMAPEMRDGSSDITQKIDVFSFGLILYQIIECVSTLEQQSQVHFRVARPEVRDIIEACLDPDPVQRPDFSEILEEIEQLRFKLIEGVDTEKVLEYFNRVRA